MLSIKVRNLPDDALPEFMEKYRHLKKKFIGEPDKELTHISFQLEVEYLQQRFRNKYHSKNIVLVGYDENKYQNQFLKAREIAELHAKYFSDTHQYKESFTSAEVNKMLEDLDSTDAIIEYDPLTTIDDKIFTDYVWVKCKINGIYR